MDIKEICSGPTKLLFDSRLPSVDDLQSEDLVFSADELVTKVRKPYTITKQRERWTEEEHEKFLDALKLYGRAWRQIQEHIGTKTAVQIRSHAQKFFSKVVREPSTEKTIEIPPPRPKRKPLHPYPRKSSHTYTKKFAALEKQEISAPPVSKQDSESPLSVLSAAGSDILGSLTSDRPNSCISTLSIAVAPHSIEQLSSKQQTRCSSPTSSATDEDNSSAPGLDSAALTAQYAIPMELDSSSGENTLCREISPSEGQFTGIKLFGQTVLLSDSQKNCSSSIGNPECSSGSYISGHRNITEYAASAPSEQCVKLPACEDLCGGSNRSMWNSWHGGMPPMYYYFTPTYDSSNPMATFTNLPQWWTYCSNLSLPFSNQLNETSKGELPQGFKGDHYGDNSEKEVSSADSSSVCETRAAFDNSIPIVAVNTEGYELPKNSAINFKLTPSENSAFTRVTVSNNKSTKGFIPYKRCVEGNQTQQYKMTGDDKEAQAVGLCL